MFFSPAGFSLDLSTDSDKAKDAITLIFLSVTVANSSVPHLKNNDRKLCSFGQTEQSGGGSLIVGGSGGGG